MSLKGPEDHPEMGVASLLEAYRTGVTTPAEVVDQLYQRLGAEQDTSVWIQQVPRSEAYSRAEALPGRLDKGEDLPLYGIPFAAKDNMDVAGLPTTAACPSYAYTANSDTPVISRLLAAGAVLIGKTNLDQFATGLVGTRSPYGIPRCVFNPDYVTGGSSSGSAVALARRQVAFSLGTDTAGSGRVPAAFNGLVGLKPTRGRISTRGIVPACQSLDCVSIFAHSCDDALSVLRVIEGYDPENPYSRQVPGSAEEQSDDPRARRGFRFGVPRDSQLDFFGDEAAAGLFEAAIQRLKSIGGIPVEFDLGPFLDAGDLLYGGPWVAERDAAVGEFVRSNPAAVHPVVRTIILGGTAYSATDAFRALHHLEMLRGRARGAWEAAEVLVLPTTGTIYSVADVLAEPYLLNAKLGRYTNFTNLLDLCAIAVPAGFRSDHTPFGITLMGEAWRDLGIAGIAARYEAHYRPEISDPPRSAPPPAASVRLAVVGAHLSGQPLNHQLVGRGAHLVRSTRTARSYRLYALQGTSPPKPGLVRVDGNGASIEVEVWELTHQAFGSFVAEVPAPLVIGTVELEDGSTVKGFLCEPRALEGARDITAHGGWRAFQSMAGA